MTEIGKKAVARRNELAAKVTEIGVRMEELKEEKKLLEAKAEILNELLNEVELLRDEGVLEKV